jgi:hypothetical protein
MSISRSQFKHFADPADEIKYLRSQVSDYETVIRSHGSASGRISELINQVIMAVPAATPPKIVYTPPKLASGQLVVDSPVSHVVHLTDWHIGQRTDGAQTEEFGVNNYEVHTARVNKLLEAVIKKTTAQRAAYLCNTCRVIGTADWVSGDIHEELLRTNEFPAPVQAVKAGFLLGNFLLGLAPHFEQVIVDLLTTDNHGRLTKKCQNEDGGLNNWSYVVAEIVKQYVSKCPNIKINIHTALKVVIDVEGTRYLTSHGHGIMGTFGIPWYGLERNKMREAMKRMNAEEVKHFDKILIGHFHTALNHEHWMIGGSLTGTTAYDHQEGRHSPPHQTSWFVHPKYRGEFDWNRWFL